MLYVKNGKRIMDVSLAAIGLFVIAPFLLVFMVILYFVNNGSPFYLHERPGMNGRVFRLIKFKTMNDNRDEYGELLPDKARLTSIGWFMRSSSLDEFPQLINVLKGDMSLVGPRPLLMEYLPRYSPEQNRRHDVKPGMTGWAQINGRNAISWDEKFRLDVWYVDNWSLWLDIRILAITMLRVVLRKGINHNSTETMPFFEGSDIEK